MTIKTYDLGPGTLTLGAGALQVAAQLTSCRVEASENVASSDAVPVLSGEELAGSERITFTYTLAGNLFQTLDTGEVVAWSWTNKGTAQAFAFVPSTAEAASVEGFTYPVPITIGGDVTGTAGNRGDKPRSDFSWRCKNGDDEPVFTAAV